MGTVTKQKGYKCYLTISSDNENIRINNVNLWLLFRKQRIQYLNNFKQSWWFLSKKLHYTPVSWSLNLKVQKFHRKTLKQCIEQLREGEEDSENVVINGHLTLLWHFLVNMSKQANANILWWWWWPMQRLLSKVGEYRVDASVSWPARVAKHT